MSLCSYPEVEDLLRRHTEQALHAMGVGVCPEALGKYTRSLFVSEDRRYLKLQDGPPLGVIALHPLSWDSEIYGIATAAFGALHLEQTAPLDRLYYYALKLVREATTFASGQGVHMLTCRVALSDLVWVQALEQSGFRTMDVQCGLVANRSVWQDSVIATSSRDVLIRDFCPSDLADLVPIANSAFYHSHLYTDLRLPREHTDRLMESWLRNDCNGRAAFVTVAELEGRACGFVAGLWDQLQEEALGIGHGHIDLIAVAQEGRNRGIGRQLVADAVRRFMLRGAHMVTVWTQATNLAALRLYYKCGFQPLGFGVTLHKWCEPMRRLDQ